MKITKSRFGEDMIDYDSREEEAEAIRQYLSGDWSRLTRLQVQEFKSCQDDPFGFKWERDHAGCFSEEVDPLDFNGLVVIYNLGRTFEEGRQMLLQRIGPHPITPLTIWELNRRLAATSSKSPYQSVKSVKSVVKQN